MYSKILIIITIVLVSYFLKKAGILSKKDGEIILNKVLFYVVIPAAIFLSISQIQLSSDLIFLPLSNWGISFICLAAAFIYAKIAKLENKTKGTLLVGVTMINIQMVAYPFLKLVYGDEAFARLILFEFGAACIAFTLAYLLAVYYGEASRGSIKESLARFAKVPLVWALFMGLGANLASFTLPAFVKDLLELVAKPLVPLLLISLGLYFEPKLNKVKHLLAGIFIRIGIGFAAGLLMVTLFNLEGLDRIVVLIASIMPIGYMTLAFSAKEKLDEEFATSLVTISIIVTLALLPILTYFFG